jgi:MFS transporter, SHS family, lactate transporter
LTSRSRPSTPAPPVAVACGGQCLTPLKFQPVKRPQAEPIAPLYLLTTDFTWITIGFVLQGAFGGALYSQLPSDLFERFPTEVRATASAFCDHQGAIFGGLVPLVLTFCAQYFQVGLVIPMLVGTAAAISVVISLLISSETKVKIVVAELQVA